jgi:hypothetical protein
VTTRLDGIGVGSGSAIVLGGLQGFCRNKILRVYPRLRLALGLGSGAGKIASESGSKVWQNGQAQKGGRCVLAFHPGTGVIVPMWNESRAGASVQRANSKLKPAHMQTQENTSDQTTLRCFNASGYMYSRLTYT